MLIVSAMSSSRNGARSGARNRLLALGAGYVAPKARTSSETKRRTPSRATQGNVSGAKRHTHRGMLALTTNETAASLMCAYGTHLTRLATKMDDPKASLDVNDLVQVGLLGLIEAWHVYDKEENSNFWLYAYARVKGAMVDELRAMRQFSRRVGRNFRMEQYVAELHDVPVDPSSDDALRCWADYVVELPDREKQILGLYVIRELGLRHIGNLYGVSESRVQQIVVKALKTLKGKMQ